MGIRHFSLSKQLQPAQSINVAASIDLVGGHGLLVSGGRGFEPQRRQVLIFGFASGYLLWWEVNSRVHAAAVNKPSQAWNGHQIALLFARSVQQTVLHQLEQRRENCGATILHLLDDFPMPGSFASTFDRSSTSPPLPSRLPSLLLTTQTTMFASSLLSQCYDYWAANSIARPAGPA